MIDKVGYTRPVTTARPGAARSTSATGGTGFADALAKAEGAGGAAASEAAAQVAATGGIGLLGIQEISEEEHRRRRAVKKGRLTLDALEKLRDALLMGAVPLSTLRSLERMVAEERLSVPDPVLASVLDEIELRAAVELAKLEMSGVKF